jgi:peptidyl-prolyl cis-trans isomerase SurA
MPHFIKRIFFVLAIVFFGANCTAQTLFTYGKNSTTVQEFLRAYNKNKANSTDKEKSLREYLDLYTNFKLKVQAAQELRLDTLAQIKFDVKNFREQIIENYLIDTKSMQALIAEAAARSKKDVKVGYYFIPNSDSLLSAVEAKNLLDYLKKNTKETDTEIAQKFTSSKLKIKYTEVGFVPVFGVKYAFENAIFNTSLGSVSNVVQTDKGFYIFKPTETRPAMGKWNVAQILFLYPPNADANTKNKIKQKADSVYNLVQAGLAFDKAAKEFSEDRASAEAGGVMAEFGAGKYNTEFENNIIALKKDNAISAPFTSTYGVHIVKRISNKTAPANTNDYGYEAELKQQIMLDTRIENERIAFAKNTMLVTGLKKNTAITEKDFYIPIDTLDKNATAKTNKFLIGKKILGTFKDGSKITGTDYLSFLQKFYAEIEHPLQTKKQLVDAFFNNKIIEKYKSNLENYNEEFKFQMQEFKEGNMLFEVMERNVWSKSSIDSAALQKYYDANKQKYLWDESADILTYTCSNETVAKNAVAELKAGQSLLSVIQKSKNSIQTDSARYELTQLENVTSKNKPAVNSFGNITTNNDGTATFMQYLRYYPANITRSFTEARGLVINDYQTVLENKWVDDLKKRYPVKYNEAVIGGLVK